MSKPPIEEPYEIRESLWRCEKNRTRTIKRVVRDKLPTHGVLVGHFIAFHKRRYCMYVPGAEGWFEIDYKDPLTQDYVKRKEVLDARTDS